MLAGVCCAIPKQLRLTYWFGFPTLIKDEQAPGRISGGFSVAICSPSMSPWAAVPTMGQIGTPALTETMGPNCHPPSARSPSAPSDFGVGGFHRALMTSARLMSKSEGPLPAPMSYHVLVALEFE